jgi:phospholipase C
MKVLAASLLLSSCLVPVAQAQISRFSHVIVVVQENRTPDNMFQGLCSPPYGASTSCSTKPTVGQYDIQTSNWLDKTSSTGVTQPIAGPLANAYDLGHGHPPFVTLCDVNASGVCMMDGAANNTCSGTCPSGGRGALYYVDNSTGIMDPYLDMATQYGWANYMFQTNQGPSFPAHQFLFGGTSAPSATDDAAGEFAAENTLPIQDPIVGCIAVKGTTVEMISITGEGGKMYPCFEHQTLADLLDSSKVSWKYYAPGATGITTAPNAIDHICQPNHPYGGECVGQEFVDNVVLNPAQILTDVAACKLSGVSWVIPSGPESDHPRSNTGLGPSWVASIVNAIGNNPKCASGETYWDDTAILITWDDWGGWYDHEAPTFLPAPQGDYQYGFRVPFIAVSAYTKAAYIDNGRHDFGSVLRFIEANFRITMGSLGFADARSTTDIAGFFNLNQPPRVFTTIPAPFDANYFLHDPNPLTDPDDY